MIFDPDRDFADMLEGWREAGLMSASGMLEPAGNSTAWSRRTAGRRSVGSR